MINIAVLGYGTVGSGVVEVINTNYDIIAKKAGEEVNVKYVLDLRDFPGDEIQSKITHNFEDIINDDEIKIVVEVMGGTNPSYDFVKQSLLKGKSVATSNKELVAKHGEELLQIARDKNVNFFFEASVGGGIPIIRPLIECLTADKIVEITGILNGTTNYILSEMTSKGKAFEDVLKVAQDLGYAEKNPSADVDGHDACRKIAILSSLAWGKTVNYEEVYTEGITNITDTDIEYAKKLSSVIKLVGTSKLTEKGISAMVAPYMLSENHPLSTVNGVFNAIFVKGNVLGDTMYYGSGAGKLTTASAVVSDVVSAVKHIGENVRIDWAAEKQNVLDVKDVIVKALIRVNTENFDCAMAKAEEIFGKCQFVKLENKNDEFAVIVSNETEGSLKEKCDKLKACDCVIELRNVIRMEG